MMLAVEEKGTRVVEGGREMAIGSESEAIAALMAANRWIGITKREELEAYARLSSLLESETVECGECKGCGAVVHPAWRRFWAEYGHLKGYQFGKAMEEKGPREPEEITCLRCGGTGKVLTERGKRVAEMVRFLYDKLLKTEGV